MNCIISRLAICHIKPLARELGKILRSLCDEKDKNSNLEAQFVLLHEQNCNPLFTLCSVCKGEEEGVHPVIMQMVIHQYKHDGYQG